MTRDGQLKQQFLISVIVLLVFLITLICYDYANQLPRDKYGLEVMEGDTPNDGASLETLPVHSPK